MPIRSRRPTRAERPPAHHTLIYDGGCEFCTVAAKRIERLARVEIEILPFSEVEGSGMLASLSAAELESSVHFVIPAGLEYHDGEAAARAFRLTHRGWVVAPLNLPGLRLLRDVAYRIVAANRGFFLRFVR